MPSIQNNQGLIVKGFNPYADAVYSNQRQRTPVQTQAPRPQSPIDAFGQDGFSFQSQSTTQGPADYTTNIKAHNLSYRLLDNRLNIKVPYANLDLIDRTPEDPLHIEGLDFNMHLKSGQVKVSDVDVTMTIRHLLAQQEKPLPVQDVRVAFDPHNQIRVEGKFKKFGIKMPFEVTGNFQATPSGELQYDLGKVKFLGLPVNGLMNTFGITLDKVLKLRDPNVGYYTRANSVFVNINKITEQPGIQATLREAKTHVGNLVLTFGDTPQAAQQAQQAAQTQQPNHLSLSGGHFYYDGYFVKNGEVRMDDKTPDTPLQMEKDAETVMNLSKGMVGVTEFKFAQMIQGKLGDDSALKNPYTTLEGNHAKLSGNMWGFVPLSLQLHFDKTDKGDLMFTPKKPKAIGIIPLPEKLVRKQVQKMIADGVPYKDGVALPSLGDVNLGRLTQVVHQKGYLILEAKDN